MVVISVADFLQKARAFAKPDRQTERALAARMRQGDADARQQLLQGYLPQVAAAVRRAPQHIQTLELVMRCRQTLARAADMFDFSQDGETFTHRLSICLRQTVVGYLAQR